MWILHDNILVLHFFKYLEITSIYRVYLLSNKMKMSHTFQICPIDFVLHGDKVPYTIFSF